MRAEVQRYYGEVLQSSADLKTNACCTVDATPEHVRAALADIHDEVLARYYGCGLVLPEVLDGTQILDLGCGTGRDCYVLSRLVGPEGRVVGLDMTAEQLAVARRHEAYHADRFGYATPNVEFIDGDIEALDQTGLEADRFDIIVSNCVINLATDKQAVLDQAWHLLKTGGEIYFADIYADRRVPDELKNDSVLYGECLSGALYWNDFLRLARQAGFADPRLVTSRPVSVEDPTLREKIGDIQFFSATCRLFKLPDLELTNEDYGQSATYLGTASYYPDRLVLDRGNIFNTGRNRPVCGNTYLMLANSRLAPFFDLEGNTRMHVGAFNSESSGSPFESLISRSGQSASPQSSGASSESSCC